MRMRNLKKEEMQARRAPTVTGEGSESRMPERPMRDLMSEAEDILRIGDLIGSVEGAFPDGAGGRAEEADSLAKSACAVVARVRGAVGAGAALF